MSYPRVIHPELKPPTVGVRHLSPSTDPMFEGSHSPVSMSPIGSPSVIEVPPEFSDMTRKRTPSYELFNRPGGKDSTFRRLTFGNVFQTLDANGTSELSNRMNNMTLLDGIIAPPSSFDPNYTIPVPFSKQDYSSTGSISPSSSYGLSPHYSSSSNSNTTVTSKSMDSNDPAAWMEEWLSGMGGMEGMNTWEPTVNSSSVPSQPVGLRWRSNSYTPAPTMSDSRFPKSSSLDEFSGDSYQSVFTQAPAKGSYASIVGNNSASTNNNGNSNYHMSYGRPYQQQQQFNSRSTPNQNDFYSSSTPALYPSNSPNGTRRPSLPFEYNVQNGGNDEDMSISAPMMMGTSPNMQQRYRHKLKSTRHKTRTPTRKDEDLMKFELHIESVLAGVDIRTTLMVKNIPNKYDQDMLLEAINKSHKGRYDFFYLPIDFKNKCNVGYAFINFIYSESIASFYEEFNEKRWDKFNSEKVCKITYARIQGKSAFIEHFKNSSLMNEDIKCRPLIFHSDGPNQGEMEPFPINNDL